MLEFKTVNFVSVECLDQLICDTYGKPYRFQQQDDCKGRGVVRIEVPVDDPYDYENDTILEVVNGDEMGVSFKAWLERDPKQILSSPEGERNDLGGIELFWYRNFYPYIDMVINDLYNKGEIPEGEYMINIDW